MLELMLCSMLTILPDYLFRRYAQGRRWGHEITLFSVWYELRWGITMCLILTVLLITTVFYNHPATTNVIAYFRTVPILPEASGRVAEIYIGISEDVRKGDKLFKLDSAKQEAALDVANKKLLEVDASTEVAKAEVLASEGQVQQAVGAYQQALDELETKQELMRRNADVVARREIERLQNAVSGREGGVAAAKAAKQAAEAKLSTQLPAEKASAQAALAQAQVELDKTTIYAGIDGRVEQFVLRPGDFVTSIGRPAGILIPEGSGRGSLQAGFGQIEAQIMKVGMIAEATCVSKPMTIIPMYVASIQEVIASGQIQATQQLADPSRQTGPSGTILAFLEPLYEGGLDDVPPGSNCIANVYTSNHDALAAGNLGTVRWLSLHVVDALALVHALILRLQAVALPFKVLIFSGGH